MIIGHQKQWEFLKKSFELGRATHAYLFEGQEGLGKKTLAIELAKEILKEDVSKKHHPDYVLIEPEKKEIQIGQIRDFIWRLSLKPVLGQVKFAIINQAHSMNEEAQNCFLKTLEEPKGNALMILITEYPQMLLPTIRSRCEIIKFYPVKRSEIEKYLQATGVGEKEIEEVAKLSMGRPGIAIDLASNPLELENRRKIIGDLIKLSNSSIAARFGYLKELSQETKELKEVLDTWLWYFRREFLSKILGKQKPGGLGSKSLTELERILRLIQETSFLISRTNANQRLALETLVLQF